MKLYPYERGGGGMWSFSHAEGGGGRTQSFGVVFTCKLKVLAILMGGTKSFLSLKGRTNTFYSVLRGGGGVQKVSDPRFPHFVNPPPCNS